MRGPQSAATSPSRRAKLFRKGPLKGGQHCWHAGCAVLPSAVLAPPALIMQT